MGIWFIPPVSTPPLVLLSRGMPPTNNPPSCGAAGTPPPPPDPPVSLLLRWRFAPLSLRALAAAVGTGGAPNEGGFPIPMPLAPPASFPVTIGALRSLVTAFFSRMPLVMSEFSAPWGLLAMAAVGKEGKAYSGWNCSGGRSRWEGARRWGRSWGRWTSAETWEWWRWRWRWRWRGGHAGAYVLVKSVGVCSLGISYGRGIYERYCFCCKRGKL